MDLDVIAKEFMNDDVSLVHVQVIGKDKQGGAVLTTIVIDYFGDDDYQYGITSKPLYLNKE